MFGELVKNLRMEHDLTLREFCRRLNCDPSNWSKIERGLASPPQENETLLKIAEIFKLEIKSEKFQELKDKASITAGNIPDDILSDDETLMALPKFFRTIRNEKPTKDELERLISSIRENR